MTDIGEILFYLQEQNDSEFTYLPKIGKGQKLRPMRYLFGWDGKEQVVLVPGKSYEFEGVLSFPNPISYPPHDGRHHPILSTPHTLWVRWVRDPRKVAKRRVLTTREASGIEQAYAVETLLLTPEANRVFMETTHPASMPDPKPCAVKNNYSPSLPPERREFLDLFWIKDTPYFMFDIKLRELLEVYYRSLLEGTFPQFVYVFGFANKMEDVRYDFELAITRHLLATRYPAGSNPRNEMIAENLERGVRQRRRPLDCVSEELRGEVAAFTKLLESRGKRAARSFCQHVEAFDKVEKARSGFAQYKAF